MNIITTSKVLNRMNKMIENAMDGESTESRFDESKMSAVECRLNQYLMMTNSKAGQLAEEQGKIKTLISDISHQTKTPIANILLYSSLLVEQENLSEEGKEIAEQIMRQSEKLSFLINALIKSSRLESGLVAVSPRENMVHELLENAIYQVEIKAKAKKIAINLTMQDETAVFDMKWTVEAIYNLLDNAVKYTQNGGQITVTTTCYEVFSRIDITDNGMGIAESEITKIFTRFHRSAAAAQSEGVGIGLFLSREIISKQGGYIKVTSTLGQGSTFSVFLPR